jgi:hypothetical protein
MAAQPVEWVLVVYYGPEAHRATYGRQVRSNRYTKDYIQLSRKREFLDAVKKLFGLSAGGKASVPLTYQWTVGNTSGAFVFKSSDRPHLKWGTSSRAPQVWKMSLTPSDSSAETIPGDPSHLDFDAAEKELALLADRGAGQPYLIAIKLRDEPRKLHLRAYLAKPRRKYAWADIRVAPPEIQALAKRTTQRKAIAWSTFRSGGVSPSAKVKDALLHLFPNPTTVIDALEADVGRALASYLRQPSYGLFFDPARNHKAWPRPAHLSARVAASADEFVRALDARFPPSPDEDAAAEKLEVDPDEVEVFRNQIEHTSFEVPDATATVKTRGSAQKAFAEVVKTNYGIQCAIAGIATKDFLVAAHIVPWSKDQSIRLDPSNGICLSLILDRAFEKGYLLIEDDHTIRIDWNRVGDDNALRSQLEPYDGRKLNAPARGGPKLEYLRRRRAMAIPTE